MLRETTLDKVLVVTQGFSVLPPAADVFIEPLTPAGNMPMPRCRYDVKIPHRASHLALFHHRPRRPPLYSAAKQSSLCAARRPHESCHAIC